ncbi:MFS transporter [Maricaulaceae bacterium EIL42A08]|nr:MFS transporter [Maricaulaceae bacterium EIL42A08]
MLVYRNVAVVMAAMLLFQLAAGGLWVVLPLAMDAAEWSRFSVGATYTAYAIGFLIGAFGAPDIIRRIGHIRAFAAFASLAAATTLGLGLGFDFIAWMVLRGGFGLAAAGLFAVSESWIADATPAENRGAVVSVYQIVGRLGLIGGPFLMAMPASGTLGSMIVGGMLLALCLLPVVFTQRGQPMLPQGEVVNPMRLFKISPAAALAACAAGVINSGLFAFLPIWAGELGEATAQAAAIIVGCAYAGSLITQWPAGFISDRLDRRVVIAVLSGVAGLAALVLAVVLNPGVTGGSILIALWGASSLAYYAIAVAHAADRSRVEELPAIASGLLMAWGAGSIIGPLMFGVAYSGPLGARGLFFLAAALSFALAAAMLWRRRQNAPVAEEEREPFVNMQATSAEFAEIDVPHDAEPRP